MSQMLCLLSELCLQVSRSVFHFLSHVTQTYGTDSISVLHFFPPSLLPFIPSSFSSSLCPFYRLNKRRGRTKRKMLRITLKIGINVERQNIIMIKSGLCARCFYFDKFMKICVWSTLCSSIVFPTWIHSGSHPAFLVKILFHSWLIFHR